MKSFGQSIREAFQWQLMIQTVWEFDWSASRPTFHTIWIRAPFSISTVQHECGGSLQLVPKARNAAHSQERQHSAAEGGRRDQARRLIPPGFRVIPL